jgi:predicted nucleic acid-binding Zn finger protein
MLKKHQQIIETRDRQTAKGMVVAMSCEIVRIDNGKETYKIQSESDIKKYYIVKFIDGTPVFCSCADFLNRIKSNPFHVCKHARAIVLAENYGLVTTTTTNQKKQKRRVLEK